MHIILFLKERKRESEGSAGEYKGMEENGKKWGETRAAENGRLGERQKVVFRRGGSLRTRKQSGTWERREESRGRRKMVKEARGRGRGLDREMREAGLDVPKILEGLMSELWEAYDVLYTIFKRCVQVTELTNRVEGGVEWGVKVSIMRRWGEHVKWEGETEKVKYGGIIREFIVRWNEELENRYRGEQRKGSWETGWERKVKERRNDKARC